MQLSQVLILAVAAFGVTAQFGGQQAELERREMALEKAYLRARSALEDEFVSHERRAPTKKTAKAPAAKKGGKLGHNDDMCHGRCRVSADCDEGLGCFCHNRRCSSTVPT